jgi:hypothetical protein
MAARLPSALLVMRVQGSATSAPLTTIVPESPTATSRPLFGSKETAESLRSTLPLTRDQGWSGSLPLTTIVP